MTVPTISSAVITAPRSVDYLTGTLDSLRSTGFDPLVVHDDAGRGPNATFRFALAELLDGPGDPLIVFQDDIQAADGLRTWLESLQWPAPPETIACLSLYCPTPLTQPQAGWIKLQPSLPMLGALATVWPRESAREFVESRPAFSGRTKTDLLIGKWAELHRKVIWVYCPSLVQHIGLVSTLSDDGLTDARRASWFVDDMAKLGVS